jgi:hypothetical protein
MHSDGGDEWTGNKLLVQLMASGRGKWLGGRFLWPIRFGAMIKKLTHESEKVLELKWKLHEDWTGDPDDQGILSYTTYH